jgi:hypothetical protein
MIPQVKPTGLPDSLIAAKPKRERLRFLRFGFAGAAAADSAGLFSVVAVSVMTIFPCCHEGLKKKKIRGKKSNPEGFKKSDIVKDQEIEATVFTKDTLGEVEEFKSNDKELNQESEVEKEIVEQELPREHKPEIDVKKLDLEDMFASNENGK